MSGLLEIMGRFGTEDRCIEHLAGLRWPAGYVCARCGGQEAWRLKERPRIYECRGCGHQESVTAGTIFHRTRTDLPKWFLAAYLMGKEKRRSSPAKFLQRELGVAYQTAWTIVHKLRHGLSEDPTWPIGGYPEAAESSPVPRWPLQMRAAPLQVILVALRREDAPGFNVRQNVQPIWLRLFKQSRLRASPVPLGLPPL